MRDPIARRTGALLPSPLVGRCLREAKAAEVFLRGEKPLTRPLLQGAYKGDGKELRFVAAFLAAGFEQEPGAALGLVDEGLEQPGGTGILVIVGKLVGLAHRGSDVLVVFHQL